MNTQTNYIASLLAQALLRSAVQTQCEILRDDPEGTASLSSNSIRNIVQVDTKAIAKDLLHSQMMEIEEKIREMFDTMTIAVDRIVVNGEHTTIDASVKHNEV